MTHTPTYRQDGHVLTSLGMTEAPSPTGWDLSMSMPVHTGVTNPRGALQGGLLATLVDVTAGRAALAAAGEGSGVPTSDLSIQYLAPITIGPAVAHARLLRHGRRRIVVQVEVHDAGRDLLAAAATVAFTALRVRDDHPEWPPIIC